MNYKYTTFQAFTFALLLFAKTALSQVNIGYNIRISDTLVVDKYERKNIGFSSYYLTVEPGDYRITNPAAARILNGETITGVDLVYTDYPAGEDFTELNRKRLIELYMHVPNAFNHQVVDWRVVKQTGAQKTGNLQKYFHGFVVYYRPLPKFTTEEKTLTNIINGISAPEDSTILKVLNRNKQWKDMLVVCDVTGSMSPYTAQLLLWMKLNTTLKTARQLVFFNDDEEKSNNQSAKLDTFGIWNVESFKFDKVLKAALKAMEQGGHVENNLEAVFYAIRKYPENKKNIIMIADNWEDPCDMRLMSELKDMKIPLRIIICGVNASLNTKYLDLAYATGGSVHTIEQDITDMAKIADGKVIKIGTLQFRLMGGKFYQVH